MKLLKLKIESDDGFRSLEKGFEINFHLLDDVQLHGSFRPLCMVGLNGCGKSNVMEALSLIFYHLELCVDIHIPPELLTQQGFSPEKCLIDAFRLEYLMKESNLALDENHVVKVIVEKKKGKVPQMFKTNPYVKKSKVIEISLQNLSEGQVSLAKMYLPKYVVGYSSGENETLSAPFVISRAIHLFEFEQATINNVADYSSPENSLIYIDSQMSQAILLCCLLFEDEKTLEPLSELHHTGISRITRFRLKMRNASFVSGNGNRYSYLELLKKTIFDKLDACATMSWFDTKNEIYYFDYWVNDETKKAFRHYFHTSMECFQVFRLLHELNYSNKFGVEDIFQFIDFYIQKKVGENHSIEIPLRQFSDGEHQFIHTIGICLLLKDSDALILLDEPETHYNPKWRSHFVRELNFALENACDNDDVNFLKEVIITSHSPFIISDCLPENVFVFEKKSNGNVEVRSAKEMGLNTYGASTGVVMADFFESTDSIGDRAYQEMKDMADSKGISKKELIKKVNAKFGDSLEKMMILGQINEKE